MKYNIAKTAAVVCMVVAVACCTSIEEPAVEASSDKVEFASIPVTFSAYKSDDTGEPTKAVLDSKNATQINWHGDDRLSVFDAASANCSFSLTEGAGTPGGKFEGNVTKSSSSYMALHPYAEEAGLVGGGKIGNVLFPSTQTAVAGTFDPVAAVMVARSEDGSLPFKNAAGYVKFTIADDYPFPSYSSVSISSRNESVAIAGRAAVALDNSGNVTVIPVENETTHRIKLNGPFKGGNTYYIALMPCTMDKGFTLTFKTDDTFEYYRSTEKSFTVEPGKVMNLGVMGMEKYDDTTPYVSFSADAPQVFKMAVGANIKERTDLLPYYSVGGGAWTKLRLSGGDSKETESIEFGGMKGNLRLRNISPEGTAVYNTRKGNKLANALHVGFEKTDIDVKGTGEIRTLVDWENYTGKDIQENARFFYLFYGCTNLVTAPALEIHVNGRLAEACYSEMFHGCTSLQRAPELPAKNLARYCYSGMFRNCSSIVAKSGPTKIVLPAQYLPISCYQSMFYGAKKVCSVDLQGYKIEIEYTDKNGDRVSEYIDLKSSIDYTSNRRRFDTYNYFTNWLKGTAIDSKGRLTVADYGKMRLLFKYNVEKKDENGNVIKDENGNVVKEPEVRYLPQNWGIYAADDNTSE